jgi:regulator of protease activity HflC (stomatin/prohibitin superfamily)
MTGREWSRPCSLVLTTEDGKNREENRNDQKTERRKAMMRNILKFVLWGGVGALLLISGVLAISEGARVTGSIVAVIGAWVLLSIKIIGPAEMAVFVVLGEPTGFRDSGLGFVPFLFARLERFPKVLFNLNFPARKATSGAGTYQALGERRAHDYEPQELTVDSVAYVQFPRSERLIQVLQAQVPRDEKGLLNWVEESAVSAVRVAVASMTWRQANADIAAVRARAMTDFTRDDGTLVLAGFDVVNNVRLTVKEIPLPERLRLALLEVEREKLESVAAPFEAMERAENTGGAVVENFARLSGMSRQAVEKALRAENAAEFISRHQQAWTEALDLTRREQAIKGRSFLDIRVQGAEGIERAFLNLLGVLQRMPTGGGGGEATPRAGQSPREPESFDKTVERFRQRRQ